LKICIVHNEYGRFSGEEAVVQMQKALLEQNGHEIILFTRSSADLHSVTFGRMKAFFSGVYNPFIKIDFRSVLLTTKPDVVHIHNLYPLISPSILSECRFYNVPLVMTVHNYRLMCPSGLFTSGGMICEKCADGTEFWCVWKNCERSLLKSLGYAFRNYMARKFRFYKDNVTEYIALTEFQRSKLISAGFPAPSISVIPNMAEHAIEPSVTAGSFIGFVGRISPEKDVTTLIEAARICEDITFKAAGNHDRMPELLRTSPRNFSFLGHLSGHELSEFIANCKIIVLSSRCYEGFPMVLVDAMLAGKPVICSRIGGLSEIVEDGITGLLFEPGNETDLAAKVSLLWNNLELCLEMGKAGRDKALAEYSSTRYYQRLIKVYGKAIKKCSN
jgi:glycosyltransferase involved in cell wall biosynthesis